MDGENKRFSFKSSLKEALFIGLTASAAATAAWLFSTSIYKTAAAVIIAGAVIFAAFFAAEMLIRNRGKALRVCSRAVLAAAGAILMICVVVRTIAPLMLFCPNDDEECRSALSEISAAEETRINGANGTISGWLVHNGGENAPLVLYFGGNGECSSRWTFGIIENGRDKSVFGGCDFAFMDYPSYGKSEGTASDVSFKNYALAVYDYFSQKYESIYIFGYSIGTGPANYVSSQRDVKGLVLFAPYADGTDLFNSQINIFHGPLRLLVSYDMDSAKFAESVCVTPLIFASDSDEVINYSSSERLSHSYKNGSELVTVKGIKHNGFMSTREVLTRLAEYFGKAAA